MSIGYLGPICNRHSVSSLIHVEPRLILKGIGLRLKCILENTHKNAVNTFRIRMKEFDRSADQCSLYLSLNSSNSVWA